MREIEVQFDSLWSVDDLVASIERAIQKLDLRIAMRATVRSYPGCVHWHIRRSSGSGTLELTVWPARQRIWFKVQSARDAPWIESALEKLKQAIERDFKRP